MHNTRRREGTRERRFLQWWWVAAGFLRDVGFFVGFGAVFFGFGFGDFAGDVGEEFVPFPAERLFQLFLGVHGPGGSLVVGGDAGEVFLGVLGVFGEGAINGDG